MKIKCLCGCEYTPGIMDNNACPQCGRGIHNHIRWSTNTGDVLK